MRRVLVYSNNRVGRTMSGPGIRSYHFAAELAKTFDVTLMAPGGPEPAPDGVTGLPCPPAAELERELAAYDVVVSQYLPLGTMRRLARRGVCLVYDLYVPFLSEGLAALARGDRRVDDLHWRAGQRLQQTALATGSAFLCASERQRDLYVGMLGALGRIGPDEYRSDPTLRTLIDVVPFGVPAEAPSSSGRRALKGVRSGIAADDVLLLWAGGIWDWLDPLTIIEAVARIAETRDDVRLSVLGRKHPDLPESAMAARALERARSLGLVDRVVFFEDDWVPYEQRTAYLLDADVGVSAHFDSLEARYAFRTRVLDYLWAGLPTITTRGDALGDLVSERGYGLVVGSEDVGGWVEAIGRLLDEAARAEIAGRMTDLRRELAWNVATGPLVRIVGSVTAEPARTRRRDALDGLELRVRTSYASRGLLGSARRVVEKALNGARRASSP